MIALYTSLSFSLKCLTAPSPLNKKPSPNKLSFQTSIFPFFHSLIHPSPTISSQQSFFDAGFGSSFGTLVFSRGIRTDICVGLFPESNGTSATVCKAKIFGAGVTNRSALRRILNGHALPTTSAADRDVIELVKVHKDFHSPTITIPSSLERKIRSRQTLQHVSF